MRENNFPSRYNAYLWEEKVHMQKFNDDNSSFYTRLPYTIISEKIILQLFFIKNRTQKISILYFFLHKQTP